MIDSLYQTLIINCVFLSIQIMAQSITIAIVLCAGLHSDPTEDSISIMLDVHRQHLEAHRQVGLLLR